MSKASRGTTICTGALMLASIHPWFPHAHHPFHSNRNRLDRPTTRLVHRLVYPPTRSRIDWLVGSFAACSPGARQPHVTLARNIQMASHQQPARLVGINPITLSSSHKNGGAYRSCVFLYRVELFGTADRLSISLSSLSIGST